MRMQDVRIAACQFDAVQADKEANLDTIRRFTGQAVDAGAEVVCFHEQCINGYNLWGMKSDRETAAEVDGIWNPAWSTLGYDPYKLAEPVPDGPSTKALAALAKEKNIILMAGIVELGEDNSVYNTYFVVGPDGFIGKYSKCHCVPGAETAYFKQGSEFPVFDAGRFRFGILICYDNHFPEAHRIYGVKGAHAIIMPHVTVGRSWWPEKTHTLEQAHEQAEKWILKWLRARAFDNSLYCVFVNQVATDGKGCLGCSMVVDPEGRVIVRAGKVDEEVIVTDLNADFFYKVRRRTHDYLSHRRPDLYWELTE